MTKVGPTKIFSGNYCLEKRKLTSQSCEVVSKLGPHITAKLSFDCLEARHIRIIRIFFLKEVVWHKATLSFHS